MKHVAIEVPGDASVLLLAEMAREQRITHLWVMSSSELQVTAGNFNLPPDQWDSLPNWLYPDNLAAIAGENVLSSVYAYKKGEKKQPVNIIFLKSCKWAWNTPDITPTELYRRVGMLEKLLDVPVAGSPSGVGMRYLEYVLRREKRPITEDNKVLWLEPPTFDLASLPWERAAKPLIWHRGLTQEEASKQFVIAVDKNGEYPHSGKRTKFGVGEPIHLTSFAAQLAVKEGAIKQNAPGIWLVTVEYPPLEEQGIHWGLLPPPLSATSMNRAIWLVTPMIKLLQKRGYPLTFHEAHVFPRAEYVWKGWAENLWFFRSQFPIGSWERESFKQIMNDTLGLVRSNKYGTGRRFRPDWNALIVGDAFAVMYYNIVKYAQLGYYPFACMMDCTYYMADSPDIDQELPGILEGKDKLGGYKKKWVIEVDNEVREILEGGALNKKLQRLNQVARERGI